MSYTVKKLSKLSGVSVRTLHWYDEAGFRTHIEKRIFEPAGMDGAIREIHSPSKSSLACFKRSGPGEPLSAIATETPEPYPHGNGCWRMTASDLLSFKDALHRHSSLIREDSFKTMQEDHLGLMIQHRDEEEGPIVGYGHPGGGPGMSSDFYIWRTEPPITAVMLSNYSDGCYEAHKYLDEKFSPKVVS